MKPVNEDSTCTFTAKFYSTNGNPFSPTSARYRVKNVTNNRVVLDWTALAVGGTEIDILIPASLNKILSNRNLYEEQALAVQAEPGADGQFTDEVVYRIKNLKAFKS